MGYYWNTKHEIDFIRKLGKHTESKRINYNIIHKELVEKYYKTMYRRTNWENINKQRIIAFCLKEINKFNKGEIC